MSGKTASASRNRAPRLGEMLAGIAAVCAIIGAWELVCRLGLISDLLLPAPSVLGRELWAACGEIASGGPMRVHVLVTLYEILAGFVLACLIGFGLGVLIAEIPFLSRMLMPYLIALNAAPKIALAPMLVIWFGFGTSSKIVMAALIAFFPLLVNVVAGIAAADPAKLRLMRSLAASRITIFTKVKLPDALPMIFAGLKTAIVLAVVGAVVGEFVGADAGLGHVIKRSEYQLDVPLTFAVIVLLSVIGIVLFYAIELLERRILFWAAPRA